MTSFLRHRTLLLVVFAVTAAIGLSSCADTFTGYVELEPETVTEDATSLNKAYQATPQKGRVAPTPSQEMHWPDSAAGAAASHQHSGDDAARPLSPPDSAAVSPGGKRPSNRVFTRY